LIGACLAAIPLLRRNIRLQKVFAIHESHTSKMDITKEEDFP
jgi:hypothetical protein